MSLSSLLKSGKLRRHKTSAREISDLFEVVRRDLKDAALTALSTDRRFCTAYNAALQLTTILMHARGYRTSSSGHHRLAFEFLAAVEKRRFEKLARYFDLCRKKRNMTNYDRTEIVSGKEVQELLSEVKKFHDDIRKLLKV